MTTKNPRKSKKQLSFGQLLLSRLDPFSAASLFRMIILILTLIVAAIAILAKVYEPVVWSFLSVIAGYAAFSNSRQGTHTRRK